MWKKFCYVLWKRKARKAIQSGLTAPCVRCADPIVPGDFVVICWTEGGDSEEKLIHAGFHFTMSNINAFCESGVYERAFWNGRKAIRIGDPLLLKLFEPVKPK